jgi:hypothetical protein
METDATPAAQLPDSDWGLPEPVRLASSHQPVTVLEELLIVRGERLLRAAVNPGRVQGDHGPGRDRRGGELSGN